MRFLSVCSGIGRPVVEMIGLKFGRLMVTERVPNPKRNDQARWRCVCECGSEIVVPGAKLRSGSTKSCGCFRRDRAGAMYRSHGLSKTSQYTMFYDARKRAIALGLPFGIEPEDIVVPAICPVLGIPLTVGGARDSSPSLDRKVPALGYVKGNVFVISFRANRIKADASVSEIAAVLAYMQEVACDF
jgi:hypothetical protein